MEIRTDRNREPVYCRVERVSPTFLVLAWGKLIAQEQYCS